MIGSREELNNYLISQLRVISVDKQKTQAMVDYIYERYNMPSNESLDYITDRKSILEATDFIAFILLNGIEVIKKSTVVSNFFTATEISELNQYSWEEKKSTIEFPLTFDCIQVKEDQWIGTTSLKTIVGLFDSGLIRYNTNTQRAMRKVMVRGEERYEIQINKASIQSIKNMMLSGNYVPTPITLNFAEDESVEYSYKAKEKTLVFNKVSAFDINDGYHRCLAMCQAAREIEGFDYPFEIRFVYFPRVKANLFTWQEDQKNLMKKIDSKAMNTTNPANVIAERMGLDPMFPYQGQVLRNGGQISKAELAEIISGAFYSTRDSEDSPKRRNEIQSTMVKWFSAFASENKAYDMSFDFKDLCICMWCMENIHDLYESVDAAMLLIGNKAEMDPKVFYREIYRNRIRKEIENIYKRVK